jgi:hypothetical protein
VFALAVESGSISPLRAFIWTWAAHIEIARNLTTAAQLRAAEHLVQTLDPSSEAWAEASRECVMIFEAAYAKVTG